MIIAVDETNLLQAAEIYSISWKESHRSFCTPDFVEMHTPESQQVYMRNKMNCGSKFYMLVEDKPIGIVSIKECLIEDLYILPDRQSMGYGTKLLQFAVEQCTGIPTLWILENNTRAKRLYCKIGFQETGRIHAVTDGLDEIELSFA
jgi:GNAT superfamily N-acetyltransferase